MKFASSSVGVVLGGLVILAAVAPSAFAQVELWEGKLVTRSSAVAPSPAPAKAEATLPVPEVPMAPPSYETADQLSSEKLAKERGRTS